ncbi:hypothetical protein O3M35_000952 [Rhynocoris fuscipes]|uniref:DUF4774 domain-containing protein n=1 Tax=Rhynocoris fuscipes TaxID=488301 RepID=A0AAW1DR69_9HEMI
MYITGTRRVPTGIRDDDEEDVGIADEGPSEGSDTVAVNQPPENASVAEAKPVGVSIAGAGGVASSQPIAQAIVGPGGLAITRPVATAISGVPGSENLVLGPGKLPAVRNYAYSVFQPHAYVIYPAATYPAVTY